MTHILFINIYTFFRFGLFIRMLKKSLCTYILDSLFRSRVSRLQWIISMFEIKWNQCWPRKTIYKRYLVNWLIGSYLSDFWLSHKSQVTLNFLLIFFFFNFFIDHWFGICYCCVFCFFVFRLFNFIFEAFDSMVHFNHIIFFIRIITARKGKRLNVFANWWSNMR